MSGSLNALLTGEFVKAILVRAAVAKPSFSLHVDYTVLEAGEFDVLFVRYLQLIGSAQGSDVEVSRRIRLSMHMPGSTQFELSFIQRERQQAEQDVQKFVHTYELNDTQKALENAFAYLATGELKHQVPA